MGVLAPAQTSPILVSQTAEPPAAALHLGWEHIKHAGMRAPISHGLSLNATSVVLKPSRSSL